MDLKKAIVVVNEFTVVGSDGSGSRGSTPGDYVTRYMARDLATEQITPIRKTNFEDFVSRYMARAEAVETLVAARRGEHGVDDEVKPTLKARRALRSAVRRAKRAGLDPSADEGVLTAARAAAIRYDDVKEAFRDGRGDGGVAFGYGEVSLSHEALHEASRDIQAHFEAGHTVMKTVLSFDHEYLVEHGLVPESMGEISRGDYRGNVDQMKLRMAVMNGLSRMARVEGFDDLRYVGVIQVDTGHVHAHLAMVDAGPGRLTADGQQRGKIGARAKSHLRRGMDSWLDEHSKVAHLSSAVGAERRNVLSHLKRWAYESLSASAAAQHVLACLPDDKSLWRAKSNAKSMAKPNRLVRMMVEEQLARPGSPMPQAMAEVTAYADERTRREGLGAAEREKLIENGRERIMEACINGVYTILKSVPEESREIRTPMMEAMSMDFDSLQQFLVDQGAKAVDDRQQGTAGDDSDRSAETAQFSARVRSYTARLEHHRRMRARYMASLAAWREADARGLAHEESKAMRDFYRGEEDYHARLVSKYEHLLLPATMDPAVEREFSRVRDYGHKLVGLRSLRADKSLARMADRAEAEALGRSIYGQPGGGLLAAKGAEGKAGRAVIDGRIERMEARYATMVDDLRASWAARSVHLEVADETKAVDAEGVPDPRYRVLSGDDELLGPDVPRTIHQPGVGLAASARPEFAFKVVRGLDMHDLGYDWLRDQTVGTRVAADYKRFAQGRRDRIEAARRYLAASGQTGVITEELSVAEADLKAMEQTAEIVSGGTLPSKIAEAVRAKRATEQARARAVRASRAAEEHEGVDRTEEVAIPDPVPMAGATDPDRRSGRTVRLDDSVGARISYGVADMVRRASREQVVRERGPVLPGE